MWSNQGCGVGVVESESELEAIMSYWSQRYHDSRNQSRWNHTLRRSSRWYPKLRSQSRWYHKLRSRGRWYHKLLRSRCRWYHTLNWRVILRTDSVSLPSFLHYSISVTTLSVLPSPSSPISNPSPFLLFSSPYKFLPPTSVPLYLALSLLPILSPPLPFLSPSHLLFPLPHSLYFPPSSSLSLEKKGLWLIVKKSCIILLTPFSSNLFGCWVYGDQGRRGWDWGRKGRVMVIKWVMQGVGRL